MESVAAATDTKIKEECTPGKPISIFTYEPPKVCSVVLVHVLLTVYQFVCSSPYIILPFITISNPYIL